MKKNSQVFRFLTVIVTVLCMGAGSLIVSAESSDAGMEQINAQKLSFSSYTYNNWGVPVKCPDPYTIEKAVTGVTLGIGDFKKPNDLFADHKGNIYLAASGDTAADNRLIKFDSRLKVIKIWTGYTDSSGAVVPFKEPQGVFVTPEDSIYVADGISKNIIEMDQQGKAIRIIAPPSKQDSTIITDDFIERYRPSKLVVDSTGRIHVVAISVNEGIVDFDPDGKFEGFLAAGKVNANPMEVLWKKISTQAQLDKMQDFVPIEYNNISLDNEDFIFATAAAIDEKIVRSEIHSGRGTENGALVRRLNMLGKDILRRKGFGPPSGDYDIFDLDNNMDAAYKGISHMVDVANGSEGTYTVLDDNRSRIFTYDSEGNLLYAFGGPDVTAGGFRTPNSIAQSGSYLYVLDSGTRTITVFRRTEFGENISQAIMWQESGDYHKSAELWNMVLTQNANYDQAYSGLGKAAYRDGEYEKAMELFELGYNKDWYSRAYVEYRKKVVADWFAPAAVTVFIAVSILLTIVKVRKVITRKKMEALEKGWIDL